MVDYSFQAANQIAGWMDYHELQWLAKEASKRNTIIEIGSWQGRSAKAISGATSGILYCIDPWNAHKQVIATRHFGPNQLYNKFCSNLSNEIKQGKVVPIRKYSHDALPILKECLPNLADMIFIDGDHSYKGTKADINNYLPLLAPGGLFCGHDYPNEIGVKQAVDEFLGKPQDYVTKSNSIWYCYPK
jgi:predicted O-methyltransferase YrrM